MSSDDEVEATRFLADIVERAMAIATQLIDFDNARDITHEIAIDVWERRQGDPGFLATPADRDRFLRSAIRHDVIDLARARRRAEARNSAHAHEINAAIHAWMHPHVAEEERELERAIEAALADMAPRRRAVFLRVRDDGMSYDAVANEMGLSVKTVQAHVVRAQAQLRLALADYRKEQK